MKVAVLITCHNRKDKTLACLEALFLNALPKNYSIEVFLVDDGSNDGTEHSVRDKYPKVNLIKGSGNLYWNGGMRVAFDIAMKKGFEFYLWLNDDTILFPTALQSLLTTFDELQSKGNVIVVGSTRDKIDGQLTYGGMTCPSKWKPIKFELIAPQGVPVECETMNGNCVLIPNQSAHALGNLEPKFVHAMGDIDYGLRACYAGFSIWLIRGYAGTCSNNTLNDFLSNNSLSLVGRLREMIKPKNLPFSSWRVFTHRHVGLFWPLFWLWPYIKLTLKGLINK